MKTLLPCLMLMMIGMGLSAQPRGAVQDRIESQRVAFLTQKLELTPDESAKFWPIYNEYKDKLQKLRGNAISERMEQRREGGGLKDLSDQEAEQLIREQFTFEESQLNLKKEYYQKFRSAISPQKLAQLGPAEMEFNRTVLEHLRDRMQERKGN